MATVVHFSSPVPDVSRDSERPSARRGRGGVTRGIDSFFLFPFSSF